MLNLLPAYFQPERGPAKEAGRKPHRGCHEWIALPMNLGVLTSNSKRTAPSGWLSLRLNCAWPGRSMHLPY